MTLGRTLTPPHKYLEVFISFSTEDKGEAQRYYDLLSADFEPWEFVKRMPPGADTKDRSIDALVESQIRRSDYFFLLVSDHSLSPDKTYCARELGLALKLREDQRQSKSEPSSSLRPIIVPIFCKDMEWRRSGGQRPTHFPVRDFHTGELQGEYALFAHDPHSTPIVRTDEDLVQLMHPRVLQSRKDLTRADQFFESGVFELYEALFPASERDDPDNIIQWVLKRDNGLPQPFYLPKQRSLVPFAPGKTRVEYEFDSRFYVLEIYQTPIAFSFITYHRASDLVCAHYIAVSRGWRGGSVAGRLRTFIEEDIRSSYPSTKGMVFEVEPVDFDLLDAAIKKAKTQGALRLVPGDEVYDQVRRFKRIDFYLTTMHALFFLDAADRQPLVYTYPCLELETDPETWPQQEEDYWLMFYRPAGFDREPPTWEQAVNFSCIEVMGKGGAIKSQDRIGALYWNYVQNVAQRSVRRAKGKRVEIGSLPLKERRTALRKSISNYEDIEL